MILRTRDDVDLDRPDPRPRGAARRGARRDRRRRATSPTLEAIELDVLGKKGRLTAVLRGIGALPAEDRPRVGAVANVVRGAIEAALAERGARPPRRASSRRASRAEAVDVTTPGRPIRRGASTRSSRRSARSPRSSASSGS